MSDLPKEIRIGTVTYTVHQDADTWLKYEHSSQTSGFYGATQFRTAEIFLNPEMTPEQTRLTLWHEVLHALNQTVMGDPDWTKLHKDPTQAEEIMVRRLEHPTLAVLRDNADLALYLLDEVVEVNE